MLLHPPALLALAPDALVLADARPPHSLHLLLWRWYGQSVPPPRTSERFFIFFAVPEFSKPSFGLHPKNCVQEQ
jgi:hypothetical protein